jgi:hypothetical protein
MTMTLDHLDRRYGGAESYLERTGVTQDDIDAVRRRLLA